VEKKLFHLVVGRVVCFIVCCVVWVGCRSILVEGLSWTLLRNNSNIFWIYNLHYLELIKLWQENCTHIVFQFILCGNKFQRLCCINSRCRFVILILQQRKKYLDVYLWKKYLKINKNLGVLFFWTATSCDCKICNEWKLLQPFGSAMFFCSFIKVDRRW